MRDAINEQALTTFGQRMRSPAPTALTTTSSSSMLLRHRRYFAALTLLLLAAPLVWGIFAPDNSAEILKEGRRLAPAPVVPSSWEELLAFPNQANAYLQDHFGLRSRMIHLHRDLSHPVLYGNESVLVGRDGRMFAQGNQMVRQSAGLILRDQEVTSAADLLARMREALEPRGIRFLAAIPPNASTIYQDDLPIWAQSHGRKTEYDLLLDALRARGVKTVDLRPPVMAVRSAAKAYLLYDTHWTPRAALAGFNAIVESDGHADWRLDPATSIGPPMQQRGGDIARLLGVQDEVAETLEPFALPTPGTDKAISVGIMPNHVITTGKPGPTIMVIGDSFTAGYFPLMLSQHIGRAIWIHHRGCGFDWKLVDKLRPDEVWWAPTERFLICDAGASPIHFSE